MLIIITGASKGIGFELAKRFAVEENTEVIAISRNIGSLLKLKKEKKFRQLIPLKADVTKASDLKKMAALVKQQNLPVSILINNAGYLVNKAFEKISSKELNQIYMTNVFAPFQLTQTLLPFFDKKTKGHIVNMGSMGGVQGSSKFAGLSAYSSSKAAIAGLTECLAEELKPLNISVNCLAIGAVQTQMLSKAFPSYVAPLQAAEMAEFIFEFAKTGHRFFNGKILPVSSTTP